MTSVACKKKKKMFVLKEICEMMLYELRYITSNYYKGKPQDNV